MTLRGRLFGATDTNQHPVEAEWAEGMFVVVKPSQQYFSDIMAVR